MKTKLLAMAMISAFALSACGGGSDSSPKIDNTTNKQNNKKDDKKDTTKPDTPKPDTPYTMQQQSASYTFDTNGVGDPIKLVSATPKYETHNGDGANYKTMVIAGKTITFKDTRGNGQAEDEHVRRVRAEENAATGFWEYVIAPSNPNITTRGTAYARYGYTIVESNNTAQVKLFYQGNPTPTNEMPTTGGATYKGFAIAIDPNKTIATNGEGDSFYGLSELNADFANKKLTGILNDWQNKHSDKVALKKVQIEADIRANTFKGTANGTGTAEGKFYGANAQNLAGAFNDKSQNLQGVFGANKQ